MISMWNLVKICFARFIVLVYTSPPERILSRRIRGVRINPAMRLVPITRMAVVHFLSGQAVIAPRPTNVRGKAAEVGPDKHRRSARHHLIDHAPVIGIETVQACDRCVIVQKRNSVMLHQGCCAEKPKQQQNREECQHENHRWKWTLGCKRRRRHVPKKVRFVSSVARGG